MTESAQNTPGDFNDTLVSILAHDLRQPLAAISMAADVMQHTGRELTAEELSTILDSLRETAARGLYLLDGLLCWIRLRKAGFAYQPQPLLLYDLLEEANSYHLTEQRQKKLRFDNLVPERELVYAHRQLLQFVNRNLLSNATKYSSSGGVISVCVGCDDGWLTVSVRDEGPGIAPERLNNLFSGELTDSENTGWLKGAGVALSICRDMLQRMNGRIWAESFEGIGTTIFYSLPQGQET